MIPDQFFSLFQTNLVVLVTKFFLSIIIFLYGIFAVVIVRQVQLMNKIVTETEFSSIIFLIALIHLLLVIGLFFLVIVLI